jgi:hypothetical protein
VLVTLKEDHDAAVRERNELRLECVGLHADWGHVQEERNKARDNKCLAVIERTQAEGMSSRAIDNLKNARVVAAEEHQ